MWGRFLREQNAASAAEFALILPLFLLFFLGIIDAGRYAWAFNQAEKATQIGARRAVVTDMIPSALVSYSYAVSCGVPQGTTVNATQFSGATCTSGAGANSATCTVSGSCTVANTANQTAFEALYTRMRQIYPDIKRNNIRVDYVNSGLGFSGDPNGPDVAPLTTVSLNGLTFQPMTLMLFNQTLPIPNASYSLTLEDGQGPDSN